MTVRVGRVEGVDARLRGHDSGAVGL